MLRNYTDATQTITLTQEQYLQLLDTIDIAASAEQHRLEAEQAQGDEAECKDALESIEAIEKLEAEIRDPADEHRTATVHLDGDDSVEVFHIIRSRGESATRRKLVAALEAIGPYLHAQLGA